MPWIGRRNESNELVPYYGRGAIEGGARAGSRFPSPEFHVPVYRRPRDLAQKG